MRPQKKISLQTDAPTLKDGRLNVHGQKNLGKSGIRSANRPQQYMYRVQCSSCGHEYGCAGVDFESRRCPGCQQGAPGEVLPEPAPMLFPV